MRARTISCLLAVLVGGAHADQIFSDGTFVNSDWTITVLADGNGGTTNGVQSAAGGNPGSFRAVQVAVTCNNRARVESVYGLHLNKNANYDLFQGSITSLG